MTFTRRFFNKDWKALLHFDYPYYNEPYDGLGDEIGLETWERSGNARLYGSQIPCDNLTKELDDAVEPKFGYRCAYFPDSSSCINGTNTSGIWNLSPGGSYEIEMFIKLKTAAAGNILNIGDTLTLSLSEENKFALVCEEFGLNSVSETALTPDEWQHIMLRISNSTAKVFLNGSEIISSEISGSSLAPEEVRLGGLIGYIDEFAFRHSAGSGNPFVPSRPYCGKLDVSSVGGYGDGSLGDVTVSDTCQINSYGMINSISDDGRTVTLNSWNNGIYAPAAGTEVMIHVTRRKDVSFYSSYNGTTNPNTVTDAATLAANIAAVQAVNAAEQAGLYAFRKISSIDGTNVTLDEPVTEEFELNSELVNNYYVQLITVPNFKNLTIESSGAIYPLTWNANTGGGIVAFRSKEDCTVGGKILTHGYGCTREDLFQMTHVKLVDHFLCNKGGGIFIAVGGTMRTSDEARLGASWDGAAGGGSGAGTSQAGHGGAGYGGGGCAHVSGLGGSGGVGGGGGGAEQSRACDAGSSFYYTNGVKTLITADLSTGGYAVQGNKLRCRGGTAGINIIPYDTQITDQSSFGGFYGGGAAGGNSGTYSTGFQARIYSGANVIIIAGKVQLAQSSISTGGQGGRRVENGWPSGGGGTGFCYIVTRRRPE